MSGNSAGKKPVARRGFIRKVLGLAAAGGLSTLLLGRQVPPVAAVGELSGSGTSGQMAYWTDASQLAGFPSQLNPGNNSIALGASNTASNQNSTVGGGMSGSATGFGSTVGGGLQNSAAASGATVAGGWQNSALGSLATVAGGIGNVVSAGFGTVGGGDYNSAGLGCTVAGGESNNARGQDSFIGGGLYNTASGQLSTIGGGISGTATALYSTIGGGKTNSANAQSATVGGGESNTAGGFAATVGGGEFNTASGSQATVGGGVENVAGGQHSTVGGGYSGAATGEGSTVGGGESNRASGFVSTVCGGVNNTAAGFASNVAGGQGNLAGFSYSTVGGGVSGAATGYASTVPGGFHNRADGDFSFAAGSYSTVLGAHPGAVLFSDAAYAFSGVAFNSASPDEFAVRATGGFRFVTGIDTSGNVTQLASINASGSLGVRTGSPSYALDLQTSGSASSQMHITPTGTDSGGYLTSANPSNLFMSAGAAWNGSAWVAKSSSAYQYGGGTAGVRFFFDTGLTVGGTYTPTTRMFIGPTGHVGIGMSTAPAHLLQLGLDDAAKPSTNTWTIASDGRLKDPESIEPFTEGSEFIRRLPQPVWFRYRKDSGLPSDRRVAGWVAQDIAPVAPFMVRRTKQKLRETDPGETETLSLNTNELPYAIVNGMKEILRKIEKLQEDDRQLLREIEQLKAANRNSLG